VARHVQEVQSAEFARRIGHLVQARGMAVQQGVRHRIAIGDFTRATVACGGGQSGASAGADDIALGQTVQHSAAGGIERHTAANQIGGEGVVETVALAKGQNVGRRPLRLCADRVGVWRGREDHRRRGLDRIDGARDGCGCGRG